MKNELGQLRQDIISAFNRSIAPADAAALTSNRKQYKAFKTVEPLLNKGEAGVAGRMPGDVPAALLPSAVASNYSSVAGTPLADLSQIGAQFIVNRVPQTGGSIRAALQNTAIGAGLMAGGMSNPIAALATIPAAAGVNAALGSPRIARALINHQPNTLTNQQLQQLMYRTAPVTSGQ